MEIKTESMLLPQNLEPSAKKKRREMRCEQCQVETSKYTCPRCGFRSCSVDCVKKHKELNSCDGMPKAWKEFPTYSRFTSEISIQEHHYLEGIQQLLKNRPIFDNLPKRVASIAGLEQCSTAAELDENIPHSLQLLQSQNDHAEKLPYPEYSLQKSVRFRRICLKTDEKNTLDGSHYEAVSDTIFWTITMRFMQSTPPQAASALQQLNVYASSPSSTSSSADSPDLQQNTGEDFIVDTATLPIPTELKECFSYTVRNIPETIAVRTLIRQFVQPKIHGPAVSRSDLDLTRLEPFLQSPDSCLVHMSTVVNGITKYFAVNQSATILDTLRNKTINGHPEFIVTLDTDRFEFEKLTQSDMELIRPVFHAGDRGSRSYHQNRQHYWSHQSTGNWNNPNRSNRGGGFNPNRNSRGGGFNPNRNNRGGGFNPNRNSRGGSFNPSSNYNNIYRKPQSRVARGSSYSRDCN